MIFLPLYRTVAQRLSEGDWPSFFDSATVPQLAAILFIQNAQRLAGEHVAQASMERQFAKMITLGNQVNRVNTSAFQALLRERFAVELFATGLSQLAKIKVALLDDDHPADESRYIDDDGEWLFTFNAAYRKVVMPLQRVYFDEYQAELSVTDPQNRALREFLAASDESFNLQGYAGSGKTHLISRFTQLLHPKRTLLLANTFGQLQALKKRAGQHFAAATFGQAAGQVLDNNLLADSWRLKDKSRLQRTFQITAAQLAETFAMPPVSYLSPEQVARVCLRTVASYCNSTAQEIDTVHLPADVASHLLMLDKVVLLEITKQYWHELNKPSGEHIRLPIRGYHRVKLLSLIDGVLDTQYSHIIVDEGHDIPTPMLQILDRSPQAVITLSDELQNLNGMAPVRHTQIRQRYIAQSVRLGKQVEDVINPLIQAHPGTTKQLFTGRSDHCTNLQHYKGWQIPNQATTIIVADEFELFAWFQRLTHAGASFELAEATFKDFMMFAQDCIGLYNNAERPRHGLIFRYASWDALREAMTNNASFDAIERMLQKGYSQTDFQQAVARYVRKGGGKIILARVSDTKNMEFSSVYLSQGLLVKPTTHDNKDSRARLFSSLYTACTRAQHELVVPDGFSDWITDAVK